MEITLRELLQGIGCSRHCNSGCSGDAIAQSPKELEHPAFTIGKQYLIRTCTNYWVGSVSSVLGQFLILINASETKDSGRLGVTIKNGLLKQDCTEIEYIGRVMINIDTIVDAMEYIHSLPCESK